MALIKYDDYYPSYRDILGKNDIKGFDVYADGDDKVGSIAGALVDETSGRFRYLIVDTGLWVFGKKVLLPVGLARLDFDKHCVQVQSLTKEQVQNLPEFSDGLKIDRDYEDRVRGVYHPMGNAPAPSNRTTYNYDQEPSMYGVHERTNPVFKLYEERLISSKIRH